jgi:flagellar biogenesis protein FliO
MKTLRSSKPNPITGEASPSPVLAQGASLSTLRSHTGLLSRAWGWLHALSGARLRVAETVSLGEKRFVAVVQVDGRHFLLAGGPANIVLLAQLDAKDAFEDVLKNTLTDPRRKQVARGKRPENSSMQVQQPAKRTSKQNPSGQRPASAPPIMHLNGTENFGDVLQKTMSAGRQPGNQPRKQNFKATAEQTGYYA